MFTTTGQRAWRWQVDGSGWRRLGLVLGSATLLLLGLLLSPTWAYAATIVVTSTSDDGPGTCPSNCTLRGAIEHANPGDTIEVHAPSEGPLPSAITLTRELVLTRNVKIEGQGYARTAISGQGTDFRVMSIERDVVVKLTDLYIGGGRAVGSGGGIRNDGGTVTLNNVYVTASAANKTLFPDGSIVVSGTGTTRTVVMTPAPNQFGTSDITRTLSDGTGSDSMTFPMIVNPVNDPPVATANTYTVVAGQSLSVQAQTGLLANDTDVDSPSLTAMLVTGPGHGTLNLATNGSFTYTPAAGYSGPDSFTYRASDGAAQSDPATVTISVTAAPPTPTPGSSATPTPGSPTPSPSPGSPTTTPTPPPGPSPTPSPSGSPTPLSPAPTRCQPRPRVEATTAPSDGRLLVRVTSSPLGTQEPNPLQQVQFGELQNARVTLNGQPVESNRSYGVPANATTVDLTVERTVAGRPATVPLTVVDGCGEWRTFVGGGAAAGF